MNTPGNGLAIEVEELLRPNDILHRVVELFVQRRAAEHIRSGKGSEFMAKAVRERPRHVRVWTLLIEPSNLWENGYAERFNGRLWDELLNGKTFEMRWEAPVFIGR